MSIFYDILIAIVSIIAILSWYLSIRQYLIIKAIKENREYKYFYQEFLLYCRQGVFNNSMEYFPFTLMLKKIDGVEYDKLNDELKSLYKKKFIFEIVFWSSFLLLFIITGFSTGWKITNAY